MEAPFRLAPNRLESYLPSPLALSFPFQCSQHRFSPPLSTLSTTLAAGHFLFIRYQA